MESGEDEGDKGAGGAGEAGEAGEDEGEELTNFPFPMPNAQCPIPHNLLLFCF
ncbi:hypothetical protein GTQ43_17815 [Nostoc sp. KVJ3]|uniref:hypothetical protein n=1 Tax=Nostoc sp. KVJ3 TaxID=457945 RepID=UPI0022380973|nr:hypothetical protein [Nostoc sp. KVJ3]MCW5315599.1 hypothetical protein [Nostoc sp. KVJ3]